MRLNKKTFPSYMMLEDGKFDLLQIDAMLGEFLDTPQKYFEFKDSIKYTFHQAKNKYLITNKFKDAIRIAAPKLESYLENIPTDCGVLFTGNGFTIYLSNPTDKDFKLLCFGFTRDCLTTYGMVSNDFKFGGYASSIKDGLPYNDKEYLNNYLNSILLTLNFIHNCEIESKVLKGNEKYRNDGVKYFNESNSDITILDCRWFTDLIREAPFRVRGHLRWQVHGEKKQKRKLIWIDEFEKSGYKRKATKSKNEV